ncbi:MAG: hypothetical protein CMA53_03820 [Euryarchaeota archaeon]|jgi:hypothetical protein|nr:hypothetical protein [Euryarchaeota archaeon]|tara:strand:+ start:1002 stop:1337 length:336 start_codon:yes stop_codon:yes gene_type:complete
MLPDHFYPYWTVYDGLGEKYCDCSHEKYAITTLKLHEGEGFTYKQINAPKPLPPHIVDVTVTTEGELPGQQGLPSANKLNQQEAQQRLHNDIKKELKESTKMEVVITDGTF